MRGRTSHPCLRAQTGRLLGPAMGRWACALTPRGPAPRRGAPRASPTTNTAGRRVARPARARLSKRRPALGRRGAGRGGLTRQHGARVAGPTPVTWVCNLCGAGPWADAVTDGFPILSRGGRALGATTGREAGGGARASGARGTVGREGRDVGHRASLGHSAEANGLRRV